MICIFHLLLIILKSLLAFLSLHKEEFGEFYLLFVWLVRINSVIASILI